MIAHADSPATATIAGGGQPAAASVRLGRAGHLGGEAQTVTLPGGGVSAGMGKIAKAALEPSRGSAARPEVMEPQDLK